MKGRILAALSVAAFLVASMPIEAGAGSVGQCNAIVARALGSINQAYRGIDVEDNCPLIIAAQFNLIDAGCVPLLENGDLFMNKIVVNGNSCNLMGVICDVAVNTCDGFSAPVCDVAPSCS